MLHACKFSAELIDELKDQYINIRKVKKKLSFLFTFAKLCAIILLEGRKNNMKVYIIYDRYEGNEFFQIYNICKSVNEVKQVYKQSLLDFLKNGPDDCHSFQCQKVELTNDQIRLLEDYMNGSESTVGYKLMENIYEIPNSNCLFSTDGYTDNIEVFEEYMSEYYPDVDEDSDEWYDAQEEFYNDDDLYETELKKYIDRNYKI